MSWWSRQVRVFRWTVENDPGGYVGCVFGRGLPVAEREHPAGSPALPLLAQTARCETPEAAERAVIELMDTL